MGECGIGCSVGAAIELSVTCYIGGDGFCCSCDVLVLKISSNCSAELVVLAPYYKKGIVPLVRILDLLTVVHTLIKFKMPAAAHSQILWNDMATRFFLSSESGLVDDMIIPRLSPHSAVAPRTVTPSQRRM